MADDQTPPVVADGKDSANPPESPKPDVVQYETHRKLLDEKKKIQKELEEIRAREKAQKDAEDLAKGNFQKLLDEAQQKIKDLEQKNARSEQLEIDRRKLAAVVKGLGGQIEDKWYTVIGQEIDQINLTEDGQIDQKSVQGLVDGLKKAWPEMIRKGAGMPNGRPDVGSPATISRQAWLALPASEMKKWKPDQVIE